MTQKILIWQMGSGFGEFAIDQSQIRDVGTPAMLKGPKTAALRSLRSEQR